MPKQKMHLLNHQEITAYESNPDKDYVKNDGGGLYVFVRRYGEKEWFFRYTSPVTSKRRKYGLGRFPDTSLADARKLAARKRLVLDDRKDPIIEDEIERRKLAQEEQQTNELKRQTVEKVFEEWKRAELQNRKDNGASIERSFKKDVFPLIGKLPISQITRNDIKDVLNRPLKRSAKRMANILLSDLKQFFGYADDEELIISDPTRRMKKSRVGGIEKSRKRFLDEEERKLLFQALPTSSLPQNYQHALCILLSTCCRVDELSKAEWKHVDLEKRTFFIPANMAKNEKEYTIHLSDFALVHFKALYEKKHSPYVFTGRDGKSPIHRQTIAKQVADRRRIKPIKGRTQKHNTLALPNGRWTPHDLRRTGATIMQELGIMPHIIEKCLNHTPQNSLIETYQRATLDEMKQQAFGKLGEYLQYLCREHSF